MKSVKQIFLLIYILISVPLFAQDNEEIKLTKRAKFIIEIATNIHYNNTSNYPDYRIGVFGNNREIRKLRKELTKITNNIHIENKNIKILQFKRTKHIEPVDLLYITGNSKIRLSSLNKKLKGRQYILLTEDFPFGTSAINFAINKKNNVFFELQDNYFKNKSFTIDKNITQSKKRIYNAKEWERKLNTAINIINKKQQTINEQSITLAENSEIIELKSKTIKNLWLIISIICISLIIITYLGIMLLKSNKQRKQHIKDINSSIHYAKLIQNAILSKDSMYDNYFANHFIINKPRNIISGDFYWMHYEDNKVFFTVADCTGHGVPGAMLTIVCHNALRRAINEFKIHEPAQILNKTSDLLKNLFSEEQHLKDGMDIALCCLHLDSNTLEFAGANNPLYYIQNNELKVIKGDRQSIDSTNNNKAFTNHKLTYKKGDTFYLFSDGYADQFGGEHNKKLLYSQFRQILKQNHKKSLDEQKHALLNNLETWQGKNKQTDDICIMGIKI